MALRPNPITGVLEDDGTGPAPLDLRGGQAAGLGVPAPVTATPPPPPPETAATPVAPVAPTVAAPPRPSPLEVTGTTSGTEGTIVSKEHKAALKQAETADAAVVKAETAKGIADVNLQDQAAKDAETKRLAMEEAERLRRAAQEEHQRKIAAAEAEEQKRKAEMLAAGDLTKKDYYADASTGKRLLAGLVNAVFEAGNAAAGGKGPSRWSQFVDSQIAGDLAKKQRDYLTSKEFYEVSKQGTAAAKQAWLDKQAQLHTDAEAQYALLAQKATEMAEKLKTPQALAIAAQANAKAQQESADRAGARASLYDRKFTATTTKGPAQGAKPLETAGREDVEAREKLRIAGDTANEVASLVDKEPALWNVIQEANRKWKMGQAARSVGGVGGGFEAVKIALGGAATPDELVARMAKDAGASDAQVQQAVKVYSGLKRSELAAAKALGGAVTDADAERISEQYSVMGRTPAEAAKALRGYAAESKRQQTGLENVRNFRDQQPTAAANAAAVGAPPPVRLTDQGKRALAALNVQRAAGTITAKAVQAARDAGVPDDVLAMYAPTTNVSAGFR